MKFSNFRYNTSCILVQFHRTEYFTKRCIAASLCSDTIKGLNLIRHRHRNTEIHYLLLVHSSEVNTEKLILLPVATGAHPLADETPCFSAKKKLHLLHVGEKRRKIAELPGLVVGMAAGAGVD
ncbi:unnamed protein product [Urochloa humidicola]